VQSALSPQTLLNLHGLTHLFSTQLVFDEQSPFSMHSRARHSTFGSPFVLSGQLHMALCDSGIHRAFLPQALLNSHGFLHLPLSHNAESGQSESMKQSPGFLHPPLTGSPIIFLEQTHEKPPTVLAGT
jgi:hypothetical protein